MGFFSRVFGAGEQRDAGDTISGQGMGPMVQAEVLTLSDPALLELMRGGTQAASGIAISPAKAMKNTTFLRCHNLVTGTIGMLPMHLMNKETKKKETDHPLFALLHRRPNSFQSAATFKALMESRAALFGDAVALIIRSPMRPNRPIALIPLDPQRITIAQNDDWTLRYEYRPPSGGKVVYRADEIFHLPGSVSYNGLTHVSMVELCREPLGIAAGVELALGRIMKNGSFLGGTLQTDKRLSAPVFQRIKAQFSSVFGGADNAGGTPLLEEGLKYVSAGMSAKDAELSAILDKQIEAIARPWGVPRPLLMVDDTSWGSGIEALGQLFVRFALNPRFAAWEQACERSLLSETESKTLEVKINAGALTRGSLADQGEYFAKARGAGGHGGWMTANEVRDMMDMPAHEDGDSLDNPMTQNSPAEPADDKVDPNSVTSLDSRRAA